MYSVDLYDGKYGLFSLLQDECKLPKPSNSNYFRNIQTDFNKNQAFATAGPNTSCFTIKYFAKDVVYSTVSKIIISDNTFNFKAFIYSN